jgi:hypothetical protein
MNELEDFVEIEKSNTQEYRLGVVTEFELYWMIHFE